MGEKNTIFQNVQIGIEGTAGTPVAANRKLLACSIVPKIRTEADAFRAMGNKYPSFVTINKEWSEHSIEGRPTYNEILYLLSSLLSQPTPAQQAGTAAYLWTFDSATSAADAGKTLTVEQGDADTGWRAAGVRVSGLEFAFSRNKCSISGAAIGEQIETGITLTAAPTSLTPLPVLPAHLAFRTAATRAGLTGATALTRGFAASFSLTDKVGLAWPVGQDPIAVEGEPKIGAKLKLATDSNGMGMIATMRAGTTQWFRITAQGALIASTYYNKLEIDFAAQIMEPGEFGDQDNVYALEYGLQPIHDATWGKAFEIRVTTTTSTL